MKVEDIETRRATMLAAQESVASEHMALCHPDGSECPDGCDAAPIRNRRRRVEVPGHSAVGPVARQKSREPAPGTHSPEAPHGRCKYCGIPKEGNAGDYYHDSDCHARDVLRRIDEHGETPELRAELEMARYVGD